MDPDPHRRAIGCATFLLAIIALELGGAFVLAAVVLLRHR